MLLGVKVILDSRINELRADCENCFGLCCVALPFAASADFPIDKEKGRPCPNLQSNFRCAIHKSLRQCGFKGCTVFGCFGAGQKVSQGTFGGVHWNEAKETATKMFDVLPIMHQLHEMLWYLKEALTFSESRLIHSDLRKLFIETEQLTNQSADFLLALDIPAHRARVNPLLLQTSEFVRTAQVSKKRKKRLNHRGADLMGVNLRGADLRTADFRGAYLIAADLRDTDLRKADFIGADFRDADIRGANLTGSIFLTQVQVNAAKGDAATKLPNLVSHPSHWSKNKKSDW